MPIKSQVACSFYLTNSCKKGEDCAFSHGQQPARVVCKHHISGSCMFGDRCRNSHDDGPETRATSTNKVPCIFWKRRSCLRGDQCHFLHEPVAPRPSELNTSWRGPQRHIVPSEENTVSKIIRQDGKFNRHHGDDGRNIQRSNIDDHTEKEFLPPLGKKTSVLSGATPLKPEVERTFFNGVRALIGPGGVVQKVVTAFDSCRVTLANIPDEATHREIIAMGDAFGPLKSVVLTPVMLGSNRIATLQYLDSEHASIAAKTLDGAELHSRYLAAQLDLRSAGGSPGIADLRSSTLKMSWFAPARMAYAHYSSLTEADSKADELHNQTFCGRKVTAVLQEPSTRQRTNFTVIIKSLPLHLNLEDLRKFCGTESMKTGEANYHGNIGITKVQELLETFGPLESFDRSQSFTNDVKIKALARFSKPEHAAAAAEKLQGQSQSFLGGAKIWVTLLHSIKYNIPRAQFHVIEDDLHRFRLGDFQSAKVRIHDKDEQGRAVDTVCIRMYGEDPKILGRLKVQIGALISGDEIIHEGMSLWDKYFSSNQGKAFGDIVRVESGAFVRLDSRGRKIFVSGTSLQKGLARELILQKIQEIRSQRQQLLLKRPQLGMLLRGELARLRGILGEDKLSLNIQDRKLVVRGDDDDVRVVQLALMSALQTSDTLPANKSDNCPVCFCAVTTPVVLACGHGYCFSCLRHYLASVEFFPVKCLAEAGLCDLPIPLSIIGHMLPDAEESKFYEDAFLTYIRQHPKEYHFCPSPDCQQIYRPAEPGSIIRCPSCLSRICPSCHVEFHEGLTCAEHRDNETGGISAYQKWKVENNVQSCPNCKVDIEKSAGCNHITCSRCDSHICWVCLATWPDSSVIYEHMRTMHGGIGA